MDVEEYRHEIDLLCTWVDTISERVRNMDSEDIESIKTVKICFLLKDGTPMHKDINVEKVRG